MHYEEVIHRLVRNPLTESITKYLLSETPKKRFDIAELSKASAKMTSTEEYVTVANNRLQTLSKVQRVDPKKQ